jgi:hypothetical protein
VCAVCGELIALVTWDGTDQSPTSPTGWKTVIRREYAHDWNGSIDSPTPNYHNARLGDLADFTHDRASQS